MRCPKCGHCESKEKGEDLEGLALEDSVGEDHGDDDFKAKDEVLAELEELMGKSMGARLGKKPAAKRKDDEDEEEVY